MTPDTLTVAEFRALKQKRKYRNKPKTVGEHKFASVAEAKRHSELLWLEKAGEISELEVHPRFSLDVNGVHIGYYTGDTAYRTPAGKVVEDVKQDSTRTTAYKLRKRLMLAIYGIEIREVG
jgi:hypothetical protein